MSEKRGWEELVQRLQAAVAELNEKIRRTVRSDARRANAGADGIGGLHERRAFAPQTSTSSSPRAHETD